MRLPRVVSIVLAVLPVAGSFLAGAGSASAGDVARGRGAAKRADVTDGKGALANLVDQIAKLAPATQPGQGWEYSNVNYQILGHLIEAVSGQEYQADVMGDILQPVGMEHSFVADGEIHDSMATGQRPPRAESSRPLAILRSTSR